MNNNRKLIISDLDGTLLNNESQLSQFTIETIKKVQEEGHIFCIATGRPIRSSIEIYNQLGLNTIMANLNGGIISNPSDKNFQLINLSFSKEILKLIFNDDDLIKNIECAFVENIDGTYIISENKNKDYVKQSFLNKIHIDKKRDNIMTIKFNECHKIDKDINSILIYINDKEKIDELNFKIKNITSTLIVRNWSLPQDNKGTVIEINSIFSTKETVAKYLSSYYAITLQNTYAFGDGENDIEMLRKSNGYAMKNGAHIAKLIAYKITYATNDNDGVALELKKLLNL